MQDHQRLYKINKQLNKLNSLIEMTKSQNNAVIQELKNYNHNTPSSSSSVILNDSNQSHSLSEIFDQTDSKNTILLPDNYLFDSFDINQSSTITRHVQKKTKQSGNKPYSAMHQSNASAQVYKQSQKQILEAKRGYTTAKKNKILKINTIKNKNNISEKEKFLHEQQKKPKLNKVKSEKKLLNNKSNLKYSVNLGAINQQKLNKQKFAKNTLQHTQNFQILPQKTYASTKMETLNSKRSKCKYSSIVKKQKNLYQTNTMRNSNHKFHIDIQNQVSMKITDLKLKKILCQVETNYLTSSMKISKDEIKKMIQPSLQNSQQKLMRFFILKSIMKFINQFKNGLNSNFESVQINENKIEETYKKCDRLIKIITKLPDILRKNNKVSDFSFRQFSEQKLFIEQNTNNHHCKSLVKQIIYQYFEELWQYIDFLLKNNLVILVKKNELKDQCEQGFYSDRSGKKLRLTAHITKQNNIFSSKKKDNSQRKKDFQILPLKRVNTTKCLKKSITSTKYKLI